MTAETNGKPARADDLARLAEEIKDDLGRAEKASEMTLNYYRGAGEGLLRAKALLRERHGTSHGRWARWLKENCGLSHRQANKYMAFANSPREANLEKEIASWRRASGAARGKGKKGKPPEPTLPDDGSRELPRVVLPKEEADEVDDMVLGLLEVWTRCSDEEGSRGYPGVVVRAIRFAHEALCGRREVAADA